MWEERAEGRGSGATFKEETTRCNYFCDDPFCNYFCGRPFCNYFCDDPFGNLFAWFELSIAPGVPVDVETTDHPFCNYFCFALAFCSAGRFWGRFIVDVETTRRFLLQLFLFWPSLL